MTREKTCCCASARALGPSARFLGTIPDVAMADAQQAELFSELGKIRSPFGGLAQWPWIDEAFERESKRLLIRSGEDIWRRKTGGVYRRGRPYCRMNSELATEVVQRIADTTGGLLWVDKWGVRWAVRLVSPKNRNDRFGFCINWCRDPETLQRISRDQFVVTMEEEGPILNSLGRRRGRQRLEEVADRVRLFRRAEQLLWVVHRQVIRTRRSVVLLADLELGQVVWGGNADPWPKDWRRELKETLVSLTSLRMEVLRIPERGWQPRLGASSVALGYFEDLAETAVGGKNRDVCQESCPIYGSDPRHHHFLVQIGYGFLGMLECFAIADDGKQNREFDFTKDPEGDRGVQLKEYRSRYLTPNVNLPAKIFGSARWATLSAGAQRIIQALTCEVTRHKGSKRSDKARINLGNVIPGAAPRSKVVCPLLGERGRYVAFGGNGKRPGQGYGIVGRDGTGWIWKCGYAVPDDPGNLTWEIRSFLIDLGEVANILGLITAALDPRSGRWFDLEELTAMARGRHGWEDLDKLSLRVYGPEDYLQRLRRYFEKQGGFSTIPGHRDEAGLGGDVQRSKANLRVRMQQACVTQRELAGYLGIAQPFVSQLLNGQRSWPDGMEQRAVEYVEMIEGRIEAVQPT